MTIADQLRSAARVPVGVLRSCVTAVDRRVGPAVSHAPVVGAVVSRVRGAAGHALGADEERLHEQPASEPTRTPSPQPDLEPATTAERENVMPEPSPESPEDQVEHLAEELLEEETDHHVGELAEDEELRRVQAELRAKHAVQEHG